MISEVYGFNLIDSGTLAGGDPNNDAGLAIAVEIFNPFDDEINVANYRISCGADDFDLPGNATIAGKERIVLYTYSGCVDDGGRRTATFSDFGFQPSGAGWHQEDKLAGFLNGSITLYREVEGHKIPVDKVDSSDIGFSPASDRTPEVRQLGARDDNPDRRRVMVAKMLQKTPTALNEHTLGSPNGLNVGDIDVLQQNDLVIDHAGLQRLGDLSKILVVGAKVEDTAPPSDSTSLPQALAVVHNNVALKMTRGRFQFLATTVNTDARYPDVPFGTLLPEFFETLSPEPIYSRIYGRININTASDKVLKCLPFPEQIHLDRGVVNVNRSDVAKYILDYRNVEGVYVLGRDKPNGVSNNIAGLRAQNVQKCYMTPGEVAIPLADYTNHVMTTQWGIPLTTLTTYPEYIKARDTLYHSIANLVTVNSDVFAVNIWVSGVQYVAILDRSNVTAPTHLPAVLMFAEVK
ncbi:MAG: lamin tail domain-containing protein [Planctomycetes bacterium]|nr:lamin tail domain-containing protein [Planctomycetota bacterium]